MTEREHGTRACYLAGCRREECVLANRAYGQEYRRRLGGPYRGRVRVQDPISGMDISDVIDEIARVLHGPHG